MKIQKLFVQIYESLHLKYFSVKVIAYKSRELMACVWCRNATVMLILREHVCSRRGAMNRFNETNSLAESAPLSDACFGKFASDVY